MTKLKSAYWFEKHKLALERGDEVKAEECFNKHLEELNKLKALEPENL